MTDLDLIGAITARAQASAPITSLTNDRISGTRQRGWPLPAYGLWIDGPKGGPVLDAPLRCARVDLHCYGPDGRTSKLLANRVLAVFVPDDGSSAAFVAAHTDVGEIEKEAEPFFLPDGDAHWPRTVVPLLFIYLGVPV